MNTIADEEAEKRILGALRSQVKCLDCGRFGHEAGDERCPRRGEGPLEKQPVICDHAVGGTAPAIPPEALVDPPMIEGANSSSSSGPSTELVPTLGLREMWENPAVRRRMLMDHMDDVPLNIKRRKYGDDPVGITNLVMLARHLAIHPGQGQWLNSTALDGISSLMDKMVTGVIVHTEPQKKLYDHARQKSNNRLCIAFNVDTDERRVALIDHDTRRGTKATDGKLGYNWLGITIFYRDRPTGDEVKTYFLDMRDGLYAVPLKSNDVNDVRQCFFQWN